MTLSANRLSLTLALLDPVTDKALHDQYKEWQVYAREKIFDGKNAPTDPNEFELRKNRKEGAQKKLMQVQDSIYYNLYSIIEHYKETHNNALNDAIGKALAIVIANHIDLGKTSTYPEDNPNDIQGGLTRFQEEIPRLRDMLKAVVTEAIKAAETAEARENAEKAENEEEMKKADNLKSTYSSSQSDVRA